MKIQILSDLHIDHDDFTESPLKNIDPSADTLIMVGDTCSVYNYDKLFNYISAISPYYKQILFIPGNHEYYCVKDVQREKMEVLRRRIHSLTKNIKNLTILDKRYIEIDDYVIAGCTLWSRFTDTEFPTYVRIYGMDRRNYNYLHHQDLEFVKKTINHCQYRNKKLILATHYPPTIKFNRNSSYHNPEYMSLYGSSLDYLINEYNVHTWIFGHNHGIIKKNIDTIINGTHIVTNQKGNGKNATVDYSKNKTLSFKKK